MQTGLATREEQRVLFSLPRANSLVGGPIEIEPGTPEQVSASEDAGGGRVPLFLTSFPSFHCMVWCSVSVSLRL